MSRLLIMELWIAAQLFINLVLVMLLWRFIRRMKKTEAELHNTFKRDDIKAVTDSIHKEVVERIDQLLHNMGEKAAVEMVDRAAQDIIELLEPLVKGSESTAASFEHQIKEKQRLIKNLNDTLDSRIISINLLLSRSEVILNSKDKSIYQHQPASNRRQNQNNNNSRNSAQGLGNDGDIRCSGAASGLYNSAWSTVDDSTQEESENSLIDQQQKIVEFYQQGLDVDTIASKLSMPRGEVQLVISLKEKFMQMER
ncbi:MAG: hypothetical protein HQK73_07155 [Desulfamplus sp.]|nr:hypothetical protein [Desulfamplus sp.]